MGYMTGIGIGNALVGLPQGIYQGEEIARRRTREDEQREMARAEFENRQTIFGRQKKQWSAEDTYNEVLGQMNAGVITREQGAQALADAGLGQYAYNIKKDMEQSDMQKKQFDQQQTIGSYQIGEYERKRQNTNITQSILGLSSGIPPTEAALNALSQQGAERGFIPKGSKIVSARLDGTYKGGIDNVEFMIDEGDGKPKKRVIDIELLGGALGVDDLRTVGTARAQRHLQQQANWLHKQGLDDNRAAQFNATLHTQRNDAYTSELKGAAGLDTQIKALEVEAEKTVNAPNKANILSKIKELENKKDIHVKSATAIAKGFKPIPYLDKDTGGVEVSQIRTVVPSGTKPGDRSAAFDYRFNDDAIFNNAGSTLIADMVERDKNSERYKKLVKDTANKWAIVVVNGDGEKKVIDGGKNPYESKAAIDIAKSKGFVPVKPPNVDFGHQFQHWDVPAAMELAETFKVKSHSSSSGSSGKTRLSRGVLGNN